jgi:tellurium resistance protein TerD
MAVSLSKGQKVDLTKTNPGLKKIIVGLGWDTNKYDGGSDFDLDASAFVLGDAGKVKDDKDFIFYNNPTGAEGAIVHLGDNRSGVGEGDDEQVKIDISTIPAHVHKIAFTITIHDAETRKQNFGQVANAYVRILNEETGVELIRYDLGEDFSTETAIVLAEVYRNGTEWKFNAIGSGFQGGLSALCTNFGLSVG